MWANKALALLGSAPRGFACSRISPWCAARQHTGRIVVSAEQDTEITLTLIEELNRQDGQLKAGKAWSTVPFSFTAASDDGSALKSPPRAAAVSASARCR